MNQMHTTAEIGRSRQDEAMARANHHHLTQIAKRRAANAKAETHLTRARVIVFRRALKIAALSVIVTGTGIIVS